MNAALFSSLRRCQHRLAVLHELRFLDSTAPRPGHQRRRCCTCSASTATSGPRPEPGMNRPATGCAPTATPPSSPASAWATCWASTGSSSPWPHTRASTTTPPCTAGSTKTRPPAWRWGCGPTDSGVEHQPGQRRVLLEYDTGSEQSPPYLQNGRLRDRRGYRRSGLARGVLAALTRTRSAPAPGVPASRRDAYPIATGVHADDPAKASLLIVGSSRRRVALTDLPQPG